MSTSRTVIWTPIASGVRPDGILRVTLAASPQLTTTSDTTLAAYPDFAGGAWCSLINGGAGVAPMEFEAVFETPGGGSASRVQARAKRVSPDPDAKVFQSMFPDSTLVKSYVADDYSATRIRSVDTAGLSDALDRLQQQVFTASRAVVPPTSALAGPGKPLEGYTIDAATYDQISRAQDEELSRQMYTSPPDTATSGGVQTAIVQMRQFVAPLDTEANVPGMLDPSYRVPWPQWEFHEKFAVLDSHPLLLRAIGFVMDVEIDPAEFVRPGGGAATLPPGTYDMWLNPRYAPGAGSVDIPQGAGVVYEGGEFAPKFSGTGPTDPGFVDIGLDGQQWPVVTSEVGSEIAATTVLASGYQRIITERIGNEDYHPLTLPARSTTGISLMAPRLAERIHRDLDRQWNIARSIDIPGRRIQIAMGADLIVGYRMDVRPAGAPGWLSLNLRNGQWRPDPDTYGTGTIDLGVDEGWTEPAGAGATGSPGAEQRYAQAVSVWTGWSQSIERPGKAIDEASEAAAINPFSPPPPGFGATIDYVAPPGGAKLPILRFGTVYDLRLRIVYLGGAAKDLGAVEPRSARRSVAYLRHEPVLSPGWWTGDNGTGSEVVGGLPAEAQTVTGVQGTEPYTWVQSPQIVVIRSAGNGASVNPRQVGTRWITPTRVSPWLVEQHGLLDSGGRPDPAKYSQIAARDAAFYGPSTPGYTEVGDAVVFAWTAPSQGTTPYYPDPLSSGVLLRGVPTPGGTTTEASAAFGGTWPDLVPVQLNVGGTGIPGASVSGQVVDLQVAPGRTERLRASSSIPAGQLGLLDLWDRVKSTASAADAAKGAFWQLTPYADITVVHATKQPVSAPYFASGDTWSGQRSEGEIQCVISGTMHIDQPSTESVSLTGTLTSGIDGGPGTPAPSIRSASVGDIGTVNVANPAPGGPVGSSSYAMEATVQLEDTRRHDLGLVGTAYSRYAEYFRQLREVTYSVGSTAPIIVLPTSTGAKQVIVPGSARVQWTSGGQSVTGTLNVDYTEQASEGTITPIAGGGIPAGSIVVSAISDPVSLSSSASATGSMSRDLVLPASARPQPPDVAWTLPAFTWNPASTATTGRSVTSTRSSASLRIYLERPWFTSGVNEDLAVLVRPSRGASAVTDYVSRWGGDPVVTGGGSLPAAWPVARHFTNAGGAVTGVQMAEDASLRVDVVRYVVGREAGDGSLIGWDDERDQWYVDLDVDIDAAYRPFIRLALARYQAGAPAALRLSPVTLLDVVQLDPARTATVAVRKAGGYEASVSLAGPSYQASRTGSGPGRTFLVHERLSEEDSPGPSAVLWQEVTRTEITGRYSGGQGRWSGKIVLGADIGGGRHRLVIEQYEEWRTDGGVGPRGSKGLRLVHQDVIALG
jgi:hypothetical protein